MELNMRSRRNQGAIYLCKKGDKSGYQDRKKG